MHKVNESQKAYYSTIMYQYAVQMHVEVEIMY